jgi:hypothetical protein
MSCVADLAMQTRTPHLCRACALPFVQLGEGTEEGTGWRVVLHCASCGWATEEVLGVDTLAQLDEELDRGLEEIASALSRFTEQNMLEYVDRFSAALGADAIVPEDF